MSTGYQSRNKNRWLIVLLFDLVSFVNAILWISFTSVNSYAQQYYNVSSSSIDLLSTIFMIAFAPGLVLCAYATQRVGLRLTCIGASALNLIAAALRYSSTWSTNGDYHGIYSLALIGQIVGALAQPISISLPARIASVWFDDDQRNLAIAVLSLSNLFGVAVGQVLPSLIVTDKSGFPTLQLTISLLAVLSLISCLIGFQEAPTTVESLSALETPVESVVHRQESQTGGLTSSFLRMWKSKSFVAISIGFGLGLAVFNVVLTKIEAVVSVGKFTSEDAGTFGGVCMLSGFVGSGIFGAALDATRSHKTILRICTVCSLTTLHVLLVALKVGGSFPVVCMMFGIFGFFVIPILPISIECAALSTSPISEEISTGVLMLIGNVAGFIATFAISDYTMDTFIPGVSLGNMILSLMYVVAAMSIFLYQTPPVIIPNKVENVQVLT